MPVVVACLMLIGACGTAESDPLAAPDAGRAQPTIEDDSDAGIAPSEVRVQSRVGYDTDGPPVAIEVGPLQRSDTAWADHDVEVSGAQIEWLVAASIPGLEYGATDQTLTPTELRPEPIVVLGFQDTVSFRIVVLDELSPGTHLYELAIPVWINPVGDPSDQPDEVVTFTIQYEVQEPEQRALVADFCEVVVPLANGREPTQPDLDKVIEAATDLAEEDRAIVVDRAEALAIDLAARPVAGYSTVALNEVIGELCNVNMLSIASSG
jgi:hypothetical protein